jgi:hypothetical protein
MGTNCDTTQHCDTSVTPKVFKFIGPSKDGRRHGRGTYLSFHNCLVYYLLALLGSNKFPLPVHVSVPAPVPILVSRSRPFSRFKKQFKKKLFLKTFGLWRTTAAIFSPFQALLCRFYSGNKRTHTHAKFALYIYLDILVSH